MVIKDISHRDLSFVTRIITGLTVLHFFYFNVILFVFKSIFTVVIVTYFLSYYNNTLLFFSLIFIPLHLFNYYFFYIKMNKTIYRNFVFNSKLNNILYDVVNGF